MKGPVGVQWGPRDRAPLSRLSLDAARAVGLTPDVYRAGRALLHHAPWHILSAWEVGELGTLDAYAALLSWEAGQA